MSKHSGMTLCSQSEVLPLESVLVICSFCIISRCYLKWIMEVVKYGGGGGGKALTMTMAPWNLPHGQWSKKLTITMTPSILPMVNGQIDHF